MIFSGKSRKIKEKKKVKYNDQTNKQPDRLTTWGVESYGRLKRRFFIESTDLNKKRFSSGPLKNISSGPLKKNFHQVPLKNHPIS